MNTVPVEADETPPSDRRQRFGQRFLTRYGSPTILIVVLLVVMGWIGLLGWCVLWLFGRVGT